ncbi:sulfite exporter TauE/SafE family protein [Acidovorax sp. FJL06]|uniref:sulfite exporter TauE/SafE family protein n=1 Tax=Acidovorax sp. FJL06 TaxID=2153365 RepID=UPI000F561454|nr:sulfite exporter TauE/SafE family protein [Acidovorax sp. FJL06]RQO82374.1 sulfite exporter TauE/SafE family protein [Acidovorax sp. FJL06]
MLATVAWTALLMGLAGGSHCLAMCAAPCGALVGQGAAAESADGSAQGGAVVQVVQWAPRGGVAVRTMAFHGGRLVGYAAAGALAALAMDSLAWLTQQTTALRPAWTLMHVAVMAWGLMMMVQSRQPAWVEQAGRVVWSRVRPLVGAPGGVLASGVLWALMPCGLLYSALLVAALSGGALDGALTMVLFGVGSGVWLAGGPWAWSRLRSRLNLARAEWGTRVAGGLLCAVAAWALWMDLVYKPSLWCR